MNALLICPADRGPVSGLSRRRPLALAPVLGRSLLDLTLSTLAARGYQRFRVLASDRPELVRDAVGTGEPWGVRAEVVPEPRESTVAGALERFPDVDASAVFPLDRLPTPPGTPLFHSARDWFQALRTLIPSGAADRVGIRELRPGVLVGRQTQIAPDATLEAPCWIGSHVHVGARSSIGPGAIVESGAYIDHDASVLESFIGPETYVGAFTEVRRSVACGQVLHNWETDSVTLVRDPVLLDDLSGHGADVRGPSLPGRLAALLVLGLTSPVVPWAWLRGLPSGEPLFRRREAVRAPRVQDGGSEIIPYHELTGVGGFARRWPELWQIACGRFAWVGNRPLTPEQAATLRDEFERMWLSVRPGLISLAELEGAGDPMSDEARAHASFYAARNGWREDVRLFLRCLRQPPEIPPSVTSSSLRSSLP